MLKVPYPIFDGNIYDYTYPGGYSNYNAMLIKVEKRVAGTGALTPGIELPLVIYLVKADVRNGLPE